MTMKAKPIFYLLVLAAGVYIGSLVVPPYFNNYMFQDTMQNAAALNTNPIFAAHADEAIRDQIYKEAQSLGLPLTRDQIYVERIGSQLSIHADYTVHIDLPYYPFDLSFHPASKK